MLIIGSDPRLTDELRSATAALERLNPVLQFVDDFRRGAEASRSWRPRIALVEMTGDRELLRTTVEEIAHGSPETAIIGVFRPAIFGPEQSESAVLIEAIRLGVKDFLRRPISSHDLARLLERLLKEAATQPGRVGRIISFVSSKGGVGKSSLAVNTAVGLAERHPNRVLIVDGSVQIGVCAALLDVRPKTTLLDAVRQRVRLDETLIRELAVPHPSGVDLLASPDDPPAAVEIDDEIMTRVLTLARRAYDFVIVDTFPLLDRLVMAVLDLSDRTYLVVENVVPTLLGAAKLVEVLDGLNYDPARQRVIVNRYAAGSGNPRPEDVTARLGRPVDRVLPHDPAWVAAANTGRPLVLTAGRFSKTLRALRPLIDDVESLSAAPSKSPPSERPTAEPAAEAVRRVVLPEGASP